MHEIDDLGARTTFLRLSASGRCNLRGFMGATSDRGSLARGLIRSANRAGASLNTVQLAALDLDGCGVAGLGPGGVGGSFDVPLGVFPFDDAGCCSASSRGVESLQ